MGHLGLQNQRLGVETSTEPFQFAHWLERSPVTALSPRRSRVGHHVRAHGRLHLVAQESERDRFCTANFSAVQLQEADAEAWRVISSVAQGKYEPLTNGPVPFDDFARICLIGTQSSVPPKPNDDSAIID